MPEPDNERVYPIIDRANWLALNAKIRALLQQHGSKVGMDAGEYWLIEEERGWTAQFLTLHTLYEDGFDLLRRGIVQRLQALLSDFRDQRIWLAIAPALNSNGDELELMIYHDWIEEYLTRELLPEDLRNKPFGVRPKVRVRLEPEECEMFTEELYKFGDSQVTKPRLMDIWRVSRDDVMAEFYEPGSARAKAAAERAKAAMGRWRRSRTEQRL